MFEVPFETILGFLFILAIFSSLSSNANLRIVIMSFLFICMLIVIPIISVMQILEITFTKQLLPAYFTDTIFSNMSYVLLVISIIFFIVILLVSKPTIIGAIRVIYYTFYKNKIFKYGYEDVAKIVSIKKVLLSERKYSSICYLIVDYNGEKIESLYFYNIIESPSYFIGEDIKIMIYKNYKYIILDKK